MANVIDNADSNLGLPHPPSVYDCQGAQMPAGDREFANMIRDFVQSQGLQGVKSRALMALSHSLLLLQSAGGDERKMRDIISRNTADGEGSRKIFLVDSTYRQTLKGFLRSRQLVAAASA
jgi:hypothetical protein